MLLLAPATGIAVVGAVDNATLPMDDLCMTSVRRQVEGPDQASRRGGGSRVVQVRLQPEEVADLELIVDRFGYASTSDALRAAIRDLAREANAMRVAAEVRDYYGGRSAPIPEGVAPATQAELDAADEADW